MTDFNINVIVDPSKANRGMDAVDKRLQKTEDQAERTRRILQRAFAFTAGALGIRELGRYADAFTNIQNRIRTVTDSTAELNSVTEQLFSISQRTRSSFQSTAELYTRTANAVRELGVSQEQTLQFTESLNQAVILSGASAIEAEAGIIQLAQGLASGALQGDELRSVLEQLPAVADVIAKEIGVTRGELRKLGSEGKISAEIVLDAFKNAREELGVRFAKAVPTLGQAFQVLENSVTRTIGRIDEITGLSSGLSGSIIDLSSSIDDLAESLAAVIQLTAAAASAYIAYQAVIKGTALAQAISAQIEYRRAIASGSVVLLGSAEAERQKAKAQQASAVSAAAAAGAALKKARANEAEAASSLNSVRAVQQQLAAERQLEVVRLQAQINSIGRQKSLTRLAEIRRSELAIVNSLAAAEARLAAARGASGAAELARSKTIGDLAKNQGAYAAATARAAGSTSLFAQAVAGLKSQLSPLLRVIAANPIAAFVGALTAGAVAVALFSDDISLGVDEVTTLADLLSAIGNRIAPIFKSLGDAIGNTFKPLGDLIDTVFGDFDVTLVGVLRSIASFIDMSVGLWKAYFGAVKEIFFNLPSIIFNFWKSALNGIISLVESNINSIIGAFNKVSDLIGIDDLVDQVNIPRLKTQWGEIGAEIGGAISDGLVEGAGARSALEELIKESQEIAKNRPKDVAAKEEDKKIEPIGTDTLSAFAQYTKSLEDQNSLLGLSRNEREVQLSLLQAEADIKRDLTHAESAYVEQLVREKQALEQLPDILASLRSPEENAIATLSEQFTEQQGIVQSAMDARILSAEEGYSTLEELAKNHADSIRDIEYSRLQGQLKAGGDTFGSLAKLAKTYAGEQSKTYQRLFKIQKGFDIASATMSIANGIAKASSEKWPLNLAAIASTVSATAGLVSTIQGTQYAGEFQNGGEFKVGGSGGTDSQMVSFRATPGESVRVATPQQDFSANQNKGAQGGAVQVNVAIFGTKEEGMAWLESQEGASTLINVMDRNKTEINATLNS